MIVEDERYLAEAIRDGLRWQRSPADIAGDVTPRWTFMSLFRALEQTQRLATVHQERPD